VGAYYKEGINPVKLITSGEYTRAARGGLGEAKTPANYAASLLPAQMAQDKGFTQVLWLDGVENRFIEEVGTMNIFFMIDNKLVTPSLEGTILSGVTRDSVITLAKEWGIEDDPVFVIDDLLPHLSRKVQDEKKMADAIEGEKLTLLFGSMPVTGIDKESIKMGVLKCLNDRFGIIEDDFISAEVEIVPAFKARDIGIDRSMIGAYGQDDRVCAYALLEAMYRTYKPMRPCLAIFADKEEIGSEGSTGIQSAFLWMTLYDILEGMGLKADEALIRKMLFKSKALSADVNGALNPTYQDVHEKQNACYLGRGICISKFTGHGGKSGASDANAEYVSEIRNLFDGEGIVWQTGELGKIDAGGGGTVAKHLAVYGMDVIDCGTPLLAMHSPFEISNKLDIYETFRAFTVFFKS
jgi:aspartyl aminopeptidase